MMNDGNGGFQESSACTVQAVYPYGKAESIAGRSKEERPWFGKPPLGRADREDKDSRSKLGGY